MAQLGERPPGGSQQVRRPIAVLDIGGMDLGCDHQAVAVGEDVPLAALDLLAGVEAPRSAAFRGLDRLAVDDAGAGAGGASLCHARLRQEKAVDACPQAVVAPRREVAVDGRARREVPGQPLRSMYGMASTTRRNSVLRRRPSRRGGAMWGPIRSHSASVRSLAWRSPLRSCCRRVIPVHILRLPGCLHTHPGNHNSLKSLNPFRDGHSELHGEAQPAAEPVVAAAGRRVVR